MKKIALLLALAAIVFQSCTTGTKILSSTGVENMQPSQYQTLPKTKSVARSNTIWILFFPFRGKNEEKREAVSLKRMLKANNADGVISGVYVHKKVTIPLIVVTYSFKWTTLTGTPYKLINASTEPKK